MKGKIKGRILAFVSDLLIATLLLGGIYGVNYLIPQKGISARPMEVRQQTAKKKAGGTVKEKANWRVRKNSMDFPQQRCLWIHKTGMRSLQISLQTGSFPRILHIQVPMYR